MQAVARTNRLDAILDKFSVKTEGLLKSARRFFDSYISYAAITLAAMAFVIAHQEVYGAIAFVAILGVILLVCDDILPTFLPFLLVSTFTTNCYNSFNTFIQYIPFAPLIVAWVVFHFVVYKKKYFVGESIYGLCAVSIALLIGGVGNYTFMDYFKGAYYYFGLGLGMIVAYFVMKSEYAQSRKYDLRERFAVSMSLMGALCVLMIALGYIRPLIGFPNYPYANGFSRNNVSTMLMFAMPFPLFLIKRNQWFAIGTLVFFGATCATGSRGGLLFGAVEFAVCAVYWMSLDKRNFKVRFGICLMAAGLILLALGSKIADIIVNRLLKEDAIDGTDRWVMMLQAVDRFFANPFVGSGILDDTIAYGEYRKAGTMAWYHMMSSQVLGSMGLVGILGYGFNIYLRFRLSLKKASGWSLVLGISYLGILLMSQVNPGEFCPVPFEVLAVLLFVMQEIRLDEAILPLKRVCETPKNLLG